MAILDSVLILNLVFRRGAFNNYDVQGFLLRIIIIYFSVIL